MGGICDLVGWKLCWMATCNTV